MLDVNKVTLVGEVSRIFEKNDALSPAVFFRVTTHIYSPDGKPHHNYLDVVAFGKNAQRLRGQLEDGDRIYVDGRLEARDTPDGSRQVQVVVISFILDIYESEQSGVDRSFDEGPGDESIAVRDISDEFLPRNVTHVQGKG